jgi:hypothetical protein
MGMGFMTANLNIIIPALSALITAIVGAYLGYRYARKKVYLSEIVKHKVTAYKETSSQIEKHYQWFHKINQALIMKMLSLSHLTVPNEIPYQTLLDSYSEDERKDISKFLRATHELSDLISSCSALVVGPFFDVACDYIATFRNLPRPQHVSDSWKLIVDILLPSVGLSLEINDFRERQKNKVLEVARGALNF